MEAHRAPRVGLVDRQEHRAHRLAQRMPACGVGRHEEHVARRASLQTGGEARPEIDVAALAGRHARPRLEMGRDADARVFEKIAADARQVGHDLDAERAQMLCRADPGAQEQGGGMERAGGDNRLPRIEADGLPSDRRGKQGRSARGQWFSLRELLPVPARFGSGWGRTSEACRAGHCRSERRRAPAGLAGTRPGTPTGQTGSTTASWVAGRSSATTERALWPAAGLFGDRYRAY